MSRGQSLVELLMAIAIAAIFIPSLLTAATASREGKAQTKERLTAVALLREATEAVRSVREKGWSNITQSGIYHPQVVNGVWSLALGEETIDQYRRSIEIFSVQRDATGTVVTSGGVVDPSSKRVVIRVRWTTPYSSSVESMMFLTRYLGNTTITQTTQSDFNAGTTTNVTVTNTNGGEVQLPPSGRADWCTPNLSITALDLPKSSAAKAVTAVEGEAFAGTGQDSSGESLVNIDITNSNPPVASIIETFDGVKTNDVFGEPNYAYVATDTNAKEVVIINIAATPFAEVGSFNAPGSEDGESIFVLGTVGYLVQDDKLWNFDLTSKSGARPALDTDGVTLAGDGKAVFVVGSYAYVATEADSAELQIVDVSNPTNMRVVASANVDGGEGQDVYVNSLGTRAYLVTTASSSKRELFIIDVSSKLGLVPIIGSYDTNGMNPQGVELATNNKVVVVGTEGQEYQVVAIANESSPSSCGGLEVNSGIFDSASIIESDGDAYAYIVTGDASSEFKIIEGGPGGQYPLNGTFESATIDLGNDVALNRFFATVDEPSGTDVTFHIALSDAVGGSCGGASFVFVGPDGTANTFYTSEGGAIFLSNPSRCLRYRAFLTTSDPSVTPTVYDVTFNYSP